MGGVFRKLHDREVRQNGEAQEIDDRRAILDDLCFLSHTIGKAKN